MYCPFKFQTNVFDNLTFLQCEGKDCALWNLHFEMCSLAVIAYLKGIEDHRKEVKAFLADRD